MKVLIACEYSGVVRSAFRTLGHNAYSCDILPAEDSQEFHLKGNVLTYLDASWDLMIAHPPCTHLAVSGARHFKYKQKQQLESLEFVRLLMNAPIAKIAIENPVSIISTHIKKPDQIIQPWQFGHKTNKKTCLWLKNLPKLVSTNIVIPEYSYTKSGKKYDKWWLYTSSLPINIRGHIRSKTFKGIAEAMAIQWGMNDL